jgi:alkanesulfonate monooxygenase SsuD/methylene tetrahydromethanopterin reductase-like flavin-dependent oxidoreductase (luciferase family)
MNCPSDPPAANRSDLAGWLRRIADRLIDRYGHDFSDVAAIRIADATAIRQAADMLAREPAEPDIAKNIGVLQAENEALRRELAEAKQDRDHWREMAMRSQFQRHFFGSPAMDGSCFACGEKHGGLVCPRTVPTAAGFPPVNAERR